MAIALGLLAFGGVCFLSLSAVALLAFGALQHRSRFRLNSELVTV